MITPRSFPGVVATDGRIYVIGGVVPSGSRETVEYFDTVAGRWEEFDDNGAPTGGLGAAMVEGAVYLVGRVPSSSSAICGALSTSSEWTWKPIPDVPSPTRTGAAVVGEAGGIFVFGGYDPDKKQYLNAVDFYRP